MRPSIPGAKQSDVLLLRSLADCNAIIERAKTARRAVMLGASFIGLEVAAALRAREIEVHVVAPEEQPMERILGPELGRLVRALHEEHGVIFHLQETASAVEGRQIRLKGGSAIEADLVVAGVGVRPRLELAEAAGLRVDREVIVDAYLETSSPGIFAAGDIARSPDPTAATPFVSSTGSSRNVRDKPRRSTCSDDESDVRTFRSSGASITISPSTMSVMRRSGTNSLSKEISRARIAWCVSDAQDARLPWPRSFATSRAWKPR